MTTVRQGKLVVRVTLSVSIVQQVGETRPAIPLRHAWNASQEKKQSWWHRVIACPKGKSNENRGLAYCLPCLPGRFGNITPDSQIAKCQKGTAIDRGGSEICLECSGGRYTRDDSAMTCLDCQQGRIRHPKRP